MTSSQSNYRHLQFGIDAGRPTRLWTDCGRPGNSRYVMAMAVCDGQLFAGIYEEGEKKGARVPLRRRNQVDRLRQPDGQRHRRWPSTRKAVCGEQSLQRQGSALSQSANWAPGGKVPPL